MGDMGAYPRGTLGIEDVHAPVYLQAIKAVTGPADIFTKK